MSSTMARSSKLQWSLKIFLLVLFFPEKSAQEDESFEILNVNAKKCLSFAPNNRLKLARCTQELGTAFEWTKERRLKGSYSYYQIRCLQVMNKNTVVTGDCTSRDAITWSCHGRTLKSGDLYLVWNNREKIVELTKTMPSHKALWVIHGTDNSVCDWPARAVGHDSTPFIQPTSSPRIRDSQQLWPQGLYTLPKASSGCPGSMNFTWREGWIYQDLDDTNEITTKSSRSFDMAAMIDEWGNIKRWFCSKNNLTQNEETLRPLWPNGTYCIYSSASYPRTKWCPLADGSFQFGYGYWDNQDLLNDSDMKGVIPRGHSDRGGKTNVFFCCQENQDPNTPMSLPTDQPFYLLAFKSSICQKVRWATVVPQFIVYDTSDDNNNQDAFEFATPFNATMNDPKIYYCYYEGCNRKLTYDGESEAVIKFPKSQFHDVTSQSCSWNVTFPANFTVSLTVKSLDIPSNDSEHCTTQFLEIFEGNVSSKKLCGSYHQYKFRFQSNSVLMVLQLAKNVTKSTGFYINIRGISSAVTLPTSPPKTWTTSTKEAYNEYTMKEKNVRTKYPHSTSKERARTPAAAKSKKDNVQTMTIVIPIVMIVVMGVVGVIAWSIMRNRKRDVNMPVTFQNECCAQSNPTYEKDHEVDKNNVAFYISVDNNVTGQKMERSGNIEKQTKHLPLFTCGTHAENPLYKSAYQAKQSDHCT